MRETLRTTLKIIMAGLSLVLFSMICNENGNKKSTSRINAGYEIVKN